MTTRPAGSTTEDDAERIGASSLEPHRGAVWGLGYRMLGTPADADDLVQDTWLRALERPPRDVSRDLRPWLITVAANLARDRLRARKRRAYVGPWLPGPVLDVEGILEREHPTGDDDERSPAGRISRRESLRFAFLVALEALTPLQRAVLILRDVFDLDTEETAQALGTSTGNVKTTLHRARRALAPYDEEVAHPSEAVATAVLVEWLGKLAAGDVAGMVALMRDDVRAVSDGGGEVLAARKVVVGAEAVARLYLGLLQKHGQGTEPRLAQVNGEPALVVTHPHAPPGVAGLFVLRLDIDDEGRVRAVSSVLAPQKVRGLAG